METSTLRYFLHVAKLENIQKASKKAHVSPSTLSKALSKLEEELAVKLFERHGRNIRLTDQGRFLKQRATQIIDLEESTRAKLMGVKKALHLSLCGQEIYLALKGIELGLEMRRTLPGSSLEFINTPNDAHALQAVESGSAHIAIIACKPPDHLFYVDLDELCFSVLVGPSHELYDQAITDQPLDIETVLKYSFVAPPRSEGQQLINDDGWPEEKWPRQIKFFSSSLNTVEKLVSSGQALAYLPTTFVEKFGVRRLQVQGIPFEKKKKLRLITRDPSRFNWLRA